MDRIGRGRRRGKAGQRLTECIGSVTSGRGPTTADLCLPGDPQQFSKPRATRPKPSPPRWEPEFIELDVDPLVRDYVQLIRAAVRPPLTWETDDLALQNIQARVRGPSVWMLANMQGACCWPPATAAKRPWATPRWTATPAADLSPIAGIDKAFLRQLAALDGGEGPAEGPIPAWRVVNRQHPRPNCGRWSGQQTDEADLMPYELFDAIERAAIRDKQAPLECFRLMRRSSRNTPAAVGDIGSSGSFDSGAAINGSANGTLPRFTSMTRTWTPRPGAAFQFSPEATGENYNSYETTSSNCHAPPPDIRIAVAFDQYPPRSRTRQPCVDSAIVQRKDGRCLRSTGNCRPKS